MFIDEYAKIHGLKSANDWCNHFRDNLIKKKLPVAMYSCLICDEILSGTPESFTNHKCLEKKR